MTKLLFISIIAATLALGSCTSTDDRNRLYDSGVSPELAEARRTSICAIRYANSRRSATSAKHSTHFPTSSAQATSSSPATGHTHCYAIVTASRRSKQSTTTSPPTTPSPTCSAAKCCKQHGTCSAETHHSSRLLKQ